MLNGRGERALLLFVVADYVLKPQQLERFTILLQLRRKARTHRFCTTGRRRRDEGHPRACFREVDLDQRVSIELTNGVSACSVVVLARRKAIDEARSDPVRS